MEPGTNLGREGTFWRSFSGSKLIFGGVGGKNELVSMFL